MAKRKPAASQAVSMSLPDRSCLIDKFRVESVVETLGALLLHDSCFRDRDARDLGPDEYGRYWSEAVSVLRRLRYQLPRDLDVVHADISIHGQLVGLDELIGRIWLVAGLGEGEAGDAFPSVLMDASDVELLAAIKAALAYSLRSERNSPDTIAVVDDTAFVDAKTLREQRRMTAAECHKFLKKNGTQSEQFVAGKVRFRKPNKKALDIHSGDWHTFWQEIDRRQSEALDADEMQDFLANAEVERAKVRSARKVGRASSRQVP